MNGMAESELIHVSSINIEDMYTTGILHAFRSKKNSWQFSACFHLCSSHIN